MRVLEHHLPPQPLPQPEFFPKLLTASQPGCLWAELDV